MLYIHNINYCKIKCCNSVCLARCYLLVFWSVHHVCPCMDSVCVLMRARKYGHMHISWVCMCFPWCICICMHICVCERVARWDINVLLHPWTCTMRRMHAWMYKSYTYTVDFSACGSSDTLGTEVNTADSHWVTNESFFIIFLVQHHNKQFSHEVFKGLFFSCWYKMSHHDWRLKCCVSFSFSFFF